MIGTAANHAHLGERFELGQADAVGRARIRTRPRVGALENEIFALTEKLRLRLEELAHRLPDLALTLAHGRARIRSQALVDESHRLIDRRVVDAEQTRRHVLAVGDRIVAGAVHEVRTYAHVPPDRRQRVVVADDATRLIDAAAAVRDRALHLGRGHRDTNRRLGIRTWPVLVPGYDVVPALLDDLHFGAAVPRLRARDLPLAALRLGERSGGVPEREGARGHRERSQASCAPLTRPPRTARSGRGGTNHSDRLPTTSCETRCAGTIPPGNHALLHREWQPGNSTTNVLANVSTNANDNVFANAFALTGANRRAYGPWRAAVRSRRPPE